MPGVTVEQFRLNIADTLNRAAYGGERILIRRHNKPVAALVPVQDLERMERMEDLADLAEAELRLKEVLKGKAKTRTLKQVKAELGL